MSLSFVDKAIEDPSFLNAVRDVIDRGTYSGFFDLLRRMALEKTRVFTAEQLQDQHALRCAWVNGYRDALDDITQFFEFYVYKDKSVKPLAEFNAYQIMLANKDITQDEYDRLVSVKE